MIFNEESQAVDWIFRYGNEALARLEECPLDVLIGNTFGSIFPNMDSKWLRSYEHSVLYGETLEIVDYSPEVDKYLRIVSEKADGIKCVSCTELSKQKRKHGTNGFSFHVRALFVTCLVLLVPGILTNPKNKCIIEKVRITDINTLGGYNET